MKTYLNIIILLFVASFARGQNKEISMQISSQINTNLKTANLYFPSSVKRFYTENGFQAAWIKSPESAGKTWEAMLLLDCVLQFGLAHADYHPYKLSFDSLHIMMETPEKMSAALKARFDVVLTDAMITFMNHLHYGKLNPEFTKEKIDNGGKDISFLAEQQLKAALQTNDFMTAVLDVQPKSKAYRELQEYMRLVKGQYTGDCYEVPENEVRLAAINMERLRWANFEEGPYIQVNIPSYTLALYEPDSTYLFKVIVGKPENPTPSLNSTIGYFTTAPDWKVPQKTFIRELLLKALKSTSFFDDNYYAVYDQTGNIVEISSTKLKQIRKNPSAYTLRRSSGYDNALGAVVFRFPNSYDIYLHDSPDQKLFDRKIRSLSPGCVRVQKAMELAELLLRYDAQADQIPVLKKHAGSYLRKDFMLKKPVPIKVTYLTCTIKDGMLVAYKDIYHLDEQLENKLYHTAERLALY